MNKNINNKKREIRTIFAGTPDFAVPSLQSLIKDGQFKVVAVITQPDKKKGRKQIITPPPVKAEAERRGITVFQPIKISDSGPQIIKLKPDLIIVVAYAQIMPESILNIPKYGIINIHGSLLPKYRGASCIQAAILNGDGETGVTIMKMDASLDTGHILIQKSIDVLSEDTAGSLYGKLSRLGAEILIPTLKKYINGEIKPKPQDNSKAIYAGLLKKRDGEINWSKPAPEIERFVRAMRPWPGAFTSLKILVRQSLALKALASGKNEHKILKILELENKPIQIKKYRIGEMFLHNGGIAVQCGKDALIIKKLQLEGKTEMKAEEFLRGYKNLIGFILK